MAEDLSTSILQLSETGELQRIHDKWMTRSTCSLDNSEIDSDRLQPKSFWGLFVICGMACFIALLIYFLQIMCQLSHSAHSDSAVNASPIRRFLSLIDEKKDPSRSGRRKRDEEERSLEDQLGRQPKRIQTETTAEFKLNS